MPHWLQPLEPLARAVEADRREREHRRRRTATSTGTPSDDAHMWWTGWTADYPDPDGFFRGLLTLGHWPFYRDEDILELLGARPLAARSGRAHARLPRGRPPLGRRARGDPPDRLPPLDPPPPPVGAGPVGEPALPRPPGQGRGRRARRRRAPRAREPQPFRSQTRRRPSSVRSGSTVSIVSACGAISSARPPVAITGAVSPISAADAPDDAVHLAGEAVDEPRLEAGDGRLPDHRRRRREVDLHEPRRPGEERLHRDLDPRREDAADVLPGARRRCRSSSTCRSRRRCRARRSARARRRRWRSGPGPTSRGSS